MGKDKKSDLDALRDEIRAAESMAELVAIMEGVDDKLAVTRDLYAATERIVARSV